MKLFPILFLCVVCFQWCDQSPEVSVAPTEKIKPDPKPLYGIELGMSAKKYKSNLFSIYKQGLANYGWLTSDYNISDSAITNDYSALYIKIDYPTPDSSQWLIGPGFLNNHLMDILLIGKPIPKDSIQEFISYLNSKLSIDLQKVDSDYSYAASSKKKVFVNFKKHQTRITFGNWEDYENITDNSLFNNIRVGNDQNVWFNYRSQNFNEYLGEEIIDVIYLDLPLHKRMVMDRFDLRNQ